MGIRFGEAKSAVCNGDGLAASHSKWSKTAPGTAERATPPEAYYWSFGNRRRFGPSILHAQPLAYSEGGGFQCLRLMPPILGIKCLGEGLKIVG